MQRVIISSLEVTDISSDRNELEFSVTLSWATLRLPWNECLHLDAITTWDVEGKQSPYMVNRSS